MTTNIAAPIERPILFSAPMVRAILAGHKTQTRRVVKPGAGQRDWLSPETIGKVRRWAQSLGTRSDGYVCRGDWWTMAVGESGPLTSLGGDPGHIGSVRYPYGAPGDRLWVREAWSLEACGRTDYEITYRADGATRGIDAGPNDEGPWCRLYDTQRGDWRPSIHMPRAASRATLEITRLRVERLSDISDRDALAEGVQGVAGRDVTIDGEWWPGGPVRAFRELWSDINGAESWRANPWVWVVDFRLLAPSP